MFGKTVEERVEDFQRKVALRSMAYGLVFILINYILKQVFGVRGEYSFVISLAVLFTYLVVLFKKVKEEEVHGDFGAFSYRGVYYPIYKGEGKEETTRKLEAKIAYRMIMVAIDMYLVGNFAFEVLKEIQVSGFTELLAVLLVVFVVSLPITALYMYNFVKMCEGYYEALTAPIIGVIYEEIRQENKVETWLYTRYLNWLTGTKLQKRMVYPTEEQEYYIYVDEEISKRMKEVRVVQSGLLEINYVDEDNREEIEGRIRQLFWEDGHDVHVDLEELVEFKKVEEQKKEEVNQEEIEEYDLEELEGKELDEQELDEQELDEQELDEQELDEQELDEQVEDTDEQEDITE